MTACSAPDYIPAEIGRLHLSETRLRMGPGVGPGGVCGEVGMDIEDMDIGVMWAWDEVMGGVSDVSGDAVDTSDM